MIDEAGPGREIVVLGRRVINFGSDSFLGLDQDPASSRGHPPRTGTMGNA